MPFDWYTHHKNRVMYTKEWQEEAWEKILWYERYKNIQSIELVLVVAVALFSFLLMR